MRNLLLLQLFLMLLFSCTTRCPDFSNLEYIDIYKQPSGLHTPIRLSPHDIRSFEPYRVTRSEDINLVKSLFKIGEVASKEDLIPGGMIVICDFYFKNDEVEECVYEDGVLKFQGKKYLVSTDLKELLFNVETFYPRPYSGEIEDK